MRTSRDEEYELSTQLPPLHPAIPPTTTDTDADTAIPPDHHPAAAAATDQHGADIPALPPTDTGRQAWLFLLACFLLEALVWGFAFSFGVFEKYYSTHEPWSRTSGGSNGRGGKSRGVAAIGTTATGIMYFSAPIIHTILRKYPRLRRPSTIAGFVLLLAALVAASFATTVWQLLLTQGVLYGFGGALHYFPAIVYLDEWFVARKGLAYGIMWAGGGAAGVAVPLVLDWALRTYGARSALRIWACVMLVLSSPAVFYLRGRLPVRQSGTGPRKVEWAFLRTWAFWFLQAGNVAQGLGYFMPSLYLPSFAASQHLSPTTGTLALSLTNAATILGAVATGFLIDRYHVTTATNVCALGSAVSVFALWGFATSAAPLYVFALANGAFSGGFAATWPGCAGPIGRACAASEGTVRNEGSGRSGGSWGLSGNVDVAMIIAVFAAGKGLGSVIGGPLSEALLRWDGWEGKAPGAYGSGYGAVIVFSGVAAAGASVGYLGKRLGLL
ncbi:uncharacterized protein K452DRAFT_310151 [Aplosporella prunicola CBS 121167]|uniref:Major facilitator superfamily (MFS) profile domain-containing protein n=1 Tax=Aplosporella prunicola CBS 121167 TaxID=1176127 RepID=A0A6A6BD30_9PEZI|nr:uncharacterized protein K452DRAFT_310151 [Aplosporella prunicola CBS 121167]KAF2140411.1 hypothetical protein K452DRAFT_310151 [Aplosporella prunicola CBS 121167]